MGDRGWKSGRNDLRTIWINKEMHIPNWPLILHQSHIFSTSCLDSPWSTLSLCKQNTHLHRKLQIQWEGGFTLNASDTGAPPNCRKASSLIQYVLTKRMNFSMGKRFHLRGRQSPDRSWHFQHRTFVGQQYCRQMWIRSETSTKEH